MTDELKKEIEAAILKNLPTEVGTNLNQILVDYEKVQKDNVALRLDIDSLKKRLSDKELYISKLENESRELSTLKQRIQAIEDAERNLKVTLAESKVTAANEKVDLMNGLLHTVFRSPIYKRLITENVSDVNNGPWDNSLCRNAKSGEFKTKNETLVEE